MYASRGKAASGPSLNRTSPKWRAATVPSAAVSGPITVANAGGSTASDAFVVAPKVTGFSPASGVAGSTLVTIGGTGFQSNATVGFGGVDPLQHYATFGFKEGRDPNAFFDTKGYLAAYADVGAAGIDPLEHYMSFGFKEGRDPSGAFDTNAYLAANPDVAAAGINPLQHFLQFGIHEGRLPQGDGIFA